jgi:hypothetical protein
MLLFSIYQIQTRADSEHPDESRDGMTATFILRHTIFTNNFEMIIFKRTKEKMKTIRQHTVIITGFIW